MPLFEFKCVMCDNIVEILIKKAIGNDRSLDCSECERMTMHVKQISTPAFKLIGEGFYENDYKRKEE